MNFLYDSGSKHAHASNPSINMFLILYLGHVYMTTVKQTHNAHQTGNVMLARPGQCMKIRYQINTRPMLSWGWNSMNCLFLSKKTPTYPRNTNHYPPVYFQESEIILGLWDIWGMFLVFVGIFLDPSLISNLWGRNPLASNVEDVFGKPSPPPKKMHRPQYFAERKAKRDQHIFFLVQIHQFGPSGCL